MDRGVSAGYQMTGISIELYDGSFHDVDSSEIAFKLAAQMAFAEAANRAKPVILEPIMKVEVVSPEKFLGDITGHLSSKRGQIQSVDERGLNKVINAEVPLAEMFGYITALRSMTEGRASYTMEFLKYDIVPSNVATTIIESRK
jgi:elongation factor G